jgi:type III secretory pathway component EscU
MRAIALQLPDSRELLRLLGWLALAALLLAAGNAFAHDLSEANKTYVQSIDGPAPVPFFYLGAKHMVTGIDHILFLIGVVFFLYRLRDVVIYVTMFTVGHSTTLLAGVLLGTGLNTYIVDAIIGFSVIYKAFENLGGFKRLGFSINTKLAVLVFGLFHGLGLATKLQDLTASENGLLANLISFNIGVEAGQVMALAVVVVLLNLWRATPSFRKGAVFANVLLLLGGVALTGYQISGYLAS